MNKLRDFQQSIIYGLCGVVVLILGVMAVVYQPLMNYCIKTIHEEISLVKGRRGYDHWIAPTNVFFRIYLFNVTNPDGVMQGELPKLVQCGPYVYDETILRQPMEIDEDNDEILYTVKRSFHFNKKETGSLSENDVVTVLNPAYMGTINTLAGYPVSFMKQYGNDIAKLFPNQKTIFVKGKVKDILFNGLKLSCNPVKYKELDLICKTLKGKKPPIIRDTEKEGVYAYSFFDKLNGTIQGPFTVNRGVKDITRLGDTTSVDGKRIQKFWETEECNTVKGTDCITWAPMIEKLPRVYTYVQETCRPMFIEYKDEMVINGIEGWRFVLTEKLWEPDEVDCYCPVVKNTKQCLPKGLLDITKCQEGPVISSEPHFLHGDPSLVAYATGLDPNEEQYLTYVVIDPLTGAPLEGRRRVQLNMKLGKQAVHLLTNVSEGYFPLLWCEDFGIPGKKLLAVPYQAHRAVNLVWFLQWIPVIVGIYIILVSIYLSVGEKAPKYVVGPITESVLALTATDGKQAFRRPRRSQRH